MQCKSLWIKASAKCINVNVNVKKCIDSLQRAFFHPPEMCETRFIMDARTLFNVFRTGSSKHLFTSIIKLRKPGQILHNTDWIRLKEESHIHLRCFDDE